MNYKQNFWCKLWLYVFFIEKTQISDRVLFYLFKILLVEWTNNPNRFIWHKPLRKKKSHFHHILVDIIEIKHFLWICQHIAILFIYNILIYLDNRYILKQFIFCLFSIKGWHSKYIFHTIGVAVYILWFSFRITTSIIKSIWCMLIKFDWMYFQFLYI